VKNGNSREQKKESSPAGKFIYNYAVQGNIPGLAASKNATSGILVDLGTRKALWAKNPKKSMPIASMTKMMTLLLAMEAIDKHENISLDTPVKVSVSAFRIGGSQVYLDPKETFPLRDLLKTVAIKSANDSAQLVAEFIGGGDSFLFVENMNNRAKELNMPGTRFFNPHGLPGDSSKEDNVSSPEGLALLAEELLKRKLAVEWASTWSYTFRAKTKKAMFLTNHNRLIKSCPGVDGMKTGFIRRSGYCTTVTCKRGSTRLVAVVTGFKARKERDKFVKKLLDWGYARSRRINKK